MLSPYYADDDVTLYAGDCVEVMRGLPDNSVDAVVTDPPYGLEFMGKEWDAPWKAAGGVEVVLEGTDKSHPFRDGSQRVRYGIGSDFQAWCVEWAGEALRVLKPGGHLVAFGGSRTWHRLACAIEDAGFEIRDSMAWMYGSGFPKSLDVSKAIDKAAGAEREVVGSRITNVGMQGGNFANGGGSGEVAVTAPATAEAAAWDGWGTALKPAYEPIVLARKPLAGTVAATVLEYGTGALNIDGCRVPMGDEYDPNKMQRQKAAGDGTVGNAFGAGSLVGSEIPTYNPAGRWPANVILDEAAAAMLDQQSGDEDGGASRFFYTSKAGRDERPNVNGIAHPTVKPLDLMCWLVRLVCPPGGTVLEPFAGSGTTAEACVVEGMRCIAIEREADYLPLIVQRLSKPIERTLL